jgi:hypothetical protein
MLTRPNFGTKEALQLAVAVGKEVLVFEPGVGQAYEGVMSIEQPRWFATVTIKNGKVVKVV